MKANEKLFTSAIHLSFLCLLPTNTYTEVPFTWMHGMYAITNSNYHHLLPIHGMVWAEEQIVDDMYRNGNANHATIKLIRELFYLQEDGVSFRPTILKSKPAAYWTPKDIGMIINAITAYRESTLNENEKETVLRQALEQIMLPQRKLMCTKEKSFIERIAAKKDILNDITQHNKSIHMRIGQTERKPSKTIAQLDQKIIELEQLDADHNFLSSTRDAIEHTIKKLLYNRKFISRALDTGIDELITYFVESTKESSSNTITHTYNVYTTEYILLTFLWKIANPHNSDVPKQDFVDYFNQLHGMIPSDKVKIWAHAPVYDKQNYAEFNQQSSMIHSTLHDDHKHCEQTILAKIGKSVWESPMPPIITDAGVLYTGPDGRKTELSPGCVETSFRNFFNIILYKQGMFDIKRLATTHHQSKDNIPLELNKKLINFYQKHTCATNLQARELYNAWARVLTHLTSIVYMKPEEYAQHARFYEVKSCFPNMLKICNYLLFSNNAHVNQLPRDKQLDLICTTVSRNDFIVSWEVIDTDITKDMLADVDYVTLQFLINNTHSFEWQLKKGHSVIPRLC